MKDPLRTLQEDGFEDLGTITLGGVLVVGDPAVLGRTPSNGAYHAAAAEPGVWRLLARAAEEDPDAIGEIVAVHESGLSTFYDLYDDADAAAELPADSGRVALLDGARKDDLALRGSLLEPEADALPWVVDDGVVVAAQAGGLPRVFQGGESPLRLVAVAFGPRPFVPAGRPLTD